MVGVEFSWWELGSLNRSLGYVRYPTYSIGGRSGSRVLQVLVRFARCERVLHVGVHGFSR